MSNVDLGFIFLEDGGSKEKVPVKGDQVTHIVPYTDDEGCMVYVTSGQYIDCSYTPEYVISLVDQAINPQSYN